MANENNIKIEQDLMEAYTHAKSYAEIGMPDVEAELLRVRDIANQRRQRTLSKRIASVAACAVAVFVIGIAYANYQEDQDICVAYVGGKHITDELQVMEMMHKDISNMQSSDGIVEHQLNDFFNE